MQPFSNIARPAQHRAAHKNDILQSMSQTFASMTCLEKIISILNWTSYLELSLSLNIIDSLGDGAPPHGMKESN